MTKQARTLYVPNGGYYFYRRADGEHYSQQLRGGALYTTEELRARYGTVLSVEITGIREEKVPAHKENDRQLTGLEEQK